ncbi:MAG TPA: hypothetical protein VKV39_03635 [Candidatus Sulfotelmatobacter sp.]|nr:hypothetical protein [Candidatus Sulfotelmatobacter sp.]
MTTLGVCLFVQLFFVFGVAGLVWPEKFMPVFGVLMFPWPATSRLVRANGLAAIAAYILIVGIFLVRGF